MALTIAVIILSVALIGAVSLLFYTEKIIGNTKCELYEFKNKLSSLRSDYAVVLKNKAELEAKCNSLESEVERLMNMTIAEENVTEEPETVPEVTLDETESKERLPKGRTNVISGMPYTAITNKASEQWKLQLEAETNSIGVRCYNDGERTYCLAAMGSAYGRTIGDAFEVKFVCGTTEYVMLADFKDDGTEPNFFGHKTKNYAGEEAICILEFIYDEEKLHKKVRNAGTFNVLPQYGGLFGAGGDIVSINYLGRKWKP